MNNRRYKKFNGFLVTLVGSLIICQVARAENVRCIDYNIYQSGTSTTPKEAQRMLVDASFPENQKVSFFEKTRRVNAHIKKTLDQKRPEGISINELSKLIVAMSDCSGHDFSIFAGLLKKESTYCLEKLNKSSKKSTASGCGQTTIWPIKEFKNHLGLPGKTKTGDPDAELAILELMNRCIPDRKQEFLDLFSQKPEEVKKYLREAEDYEMDLFVSALYLKFQYGQRGFYYNPHSKSAGALSRYGEGAGYAGLVDGFARDVRKSNQICFDDTEYIMEIEQTSCELTEDPAACSLTTPTFDI